ncbi:MULTISPECIES: response regulator [unclassified Paenibacillus]|uniref:response regulator transcription factor n=1 Tax=unclassified Paenibacillus TaxID=185978 RepID=UPI00277DD98F|nr:MULTISPECIES: response regulator [unclassified Paenibacillus]MDQ0899390.1 two-component system response regulator YesN [Paenibacillus sp. V4I7]MDQ0914567.1 two-component system response regulator YesN [Paenibacillus sp. V4I5]
MIKSTIDMCIIDDIASVIEGISTKIDWERHNIHVCGTGLNGEQGLKLVEQHRPGIIVTDIRMPIIDGLEFTRRAKEMNPDSKIILLTGYNDFEYAQKAVQLGAFDFITKPFSLEQIEQAVLKAKRALDVERVKAVQVQYLEQRVKDSMPVLRQEYFNLLIHHRTSEENIREKWDFLQIQVAPERLVIMVMEIDQFHENLGKLPVHDVELIRFSLQNIVEETLQVYTKCIVFRETNSRFVAIFNATEDLGGTSLAEKCCEHIAQYTKFTVSIGVGQCVNGIHEVPDSYGQAISALSYHFYTGGNGVIVYGDIACSEPQLPRYALAKEQELFYALRSGNREQALAMLEELFAELMGTIPLPEPETIEKTLNELGYMMLRVFQEKLQQDELSAIESNAREMRQAQHASLKDLQRQIKELGEEGCRLIAGKYSTESAKVIDEAVAYMRSNLHMNLSVNHCAKQVHLSGSYFANLFKRHTGTTFNQFVTQERMERAKAMLLDDLNVQEISDTLGFVERRYFSDVFKKQVGMTPSEFKQHYLGKPVSTNHQGEVSSS